MIFELRFKRLPKDNTGTATYTCPPRRLKNLKVDIGIDYDENLLEAKEWNRDVETQIIQCIFHETMHPLIDWGSGKDVPNNVADKIIETIEKIVFEE